MKLYETSMTSSALEDVYIDDIEQVRSIIDPAATAWQTDRWIFRGQSNSMWPLICSAHRECSVVKFSRVVDKLKNNKDFIYMLERSMKNLERIASKDQSFTLYRDKAEYIFWQFLSELYLVHEFTQAANKIGLHIYENDLKKTPHMTVSFRNGKFEAERPAPNIESYALAQHHKVPTRLLDWSYDPRVALFWASHNYEGEQDIAVYALQIDKLDYLEFKTHEVFPNHRFSYLHKQRGCFIEILNAPDYYYKYGAWPSVEDIANKQGLKIRKFTINSTLLPEINARLRKANISLSALMPTYDNVAEDTLRQF